MKTNVKTRQRNLLACLIIMSMVFTMILGSGWTSSFAADTAKITVKNVEKNATVTAYRIVKKNDNGDWGVVFDNSIADVKAPTGDEITALAKRTDLGTGIKLEPDNSNYSKDVAPGMYLILVSGTNGATVYNPMIVSVNIDGANLKPGEVDAKENFTVGGINDNPVVYAKSTTPTVDKKIKGKMGNTSVTGDDSVYGDTLKPGDETSFEITTTIPSYSKQFDNDKLHFSISDTVSAGLDAPTNIEVDAPDTDGFTTDKSKFEITKSNGDKSFTVNFKKAYLLSGDSSKDVKVTYKAKLNANASSGFDANTNTAKVSYSHDPKNVENHKEYEKKTYHYTFDIDGDISASKNKKGKEIIKVGIDGNGNQVISTTEIDLGQIKGKLKDAKFALYKADDDGHATGNPVATATTNDNGLMKMTKLDAGKYVLKETKAPAGYVLDETEIPVEINATLDVATGKLMSYTIKVAGNISSTYNATYKADSDEITSINDQTGNASALIQNKKPGALPSTGGMGTYIFMIAGAALIALAAGLYVRNRKKQTA